MAESCLLCYITDRRDLAQDEPTRRKRLLDKIAECTRASVDYIQLREKDLTIRELESLAREAVALLNKLRAENPELRTKLLINSRTDVAMAVGADGVHLRSDDISPSEVDAVWKEAQKGTATLSPRQATLIGVSCHSTEEVKRAEANGAAFAVFAPVFEKKDAPGSQPAGVAQLREACKARIPVLALGGITLENANSCLEAGASGIAAIRLFQENNVAKVVNIVRQFKH